jgi:hypothetical protein
MSTPSDGQVPYVECGCGFTAVGFDEARNAVMLADHACPYSGEPAPTRWYQAAFSPSLWFVIGVFAVIAICVSGRQG